MRIGGDHGAIAAAGARFEATGQQALTAAVRASGCSQDMDAALTELTTALETAFQQTAADLSQRVSRARAQLEAADWTGSSREQALAIEAALHADVDRVLERALSGVAAFRASASRQAEQFRAGVEGELRAILTDLDDAYRRAGAVSRQVAEGLAAVDRTIAFGG